MPEREGFVPEETEEKASSLDSIDFSKGTELTEEDVEGLDLKDIDPLMNINVELEVVFHDKFLESEKKGFLKQREESWVEAGINEGDSEKLRAAKMVALSKGADERREEATRRMRGVLKGDGDRPTQF